tara:strand:- start:124 stop:429 length:306 start_codon:yes stop_codon:yes gene_type:complete
MITGNLVIMFIIGTIIFCFYMIGLLYAIWWGHNSQKQDMLNDPELRNYYSRHGQPDNIDYDGHGNWGRFPYDPNERKSNGVVLREKKKRRKKKVKDGKTLW